MARLKMVVALALVAVASGTVVNVEPAASAAGQIASISCSQWIGPTGDGEKIGWEDFNDDFTQIDGQGGAAVPMWLDPDSQYWSLVDNTTDGNEVAVVWMLCVPGSYDVTEDDMRTIYGFIRDRWPYQPIYVIPLNVERDICPRGGYDESVIERDWALANLAGTLPGPELTPTLQLDETEDGCHANQAGVDRYQPLLEVWVPIMLEGGVFYSGTFWDDDGSTHEGYIEAIVAEGITFGCDANDPGRYCPDDPVTRAQMASFIDRAFDLPDTQTDFFDDDDGSTHEDSINAVAAAGITVGCDQSGDNFCPNEIVTRSQMASFIDRSIELNATATDFFIDDDGITHEAAINRVAADGITLGCFANDPQYFCPWDPVTRGQMASFLGRALDLDEIFPES